MGQFYGDNQRWFIGKVADNAANISDPSETARIKVKIFGLHDDPSLKIPDDLPWAQVVVPVTEGGGSGIGNNGIGIQPQSLVFGIFLDGKNSQLPLVLGSIPTNENFHQDLVNSEKASEDMNDVHGGLTDQQVKGTRNADGVRTDDRYSKEAIKFTLTGSSNIEKAFNWFLSEQGGGYTPAQACGLLGNFWVESGNAGIPNDINPRAENPTKEASRGIAQWNPINKGEPRDYVHPESRLAGLQRFAAKLGIGWLELHTQLMWVTHELERMSLKGKLSRCKTPEEAARLVEVKYEVPEGYKDYYSHSSPRRRKAAKSLFDQLTVGNT
tara:strand:+ start:1070 stop:2047 length:978 start_codon:yes stop_codon:yes gene_type:complete